MVSGKGAFLGKTLLSSAVVLLFWMALLVPAALVPTALVPTVLVPTVLVPAAWAVDECGASSAFTSRYSAHSSSPSTPYAAGTIVSTGTGAARKLWRWTSSVTTTTAPTSQNNQGWEDVTTQFAHQEVVCDDADGLTTNTNITYNSNLLAILYNRVATVNSITHTGSGGEVHINAGGVLRADDGIDPPGEDPRAAVHIVNAGANALRFALAAGVSVSNLDASARSRGIYMVGGGNVFLDIAGDVSSQATGSSGVYVNSSGSAVVDISGSVTTEAATAVFFARNGSSSGLLNVDFSGSISAGGLGTGIFSDRSALGNVTMALSGSIAAGGSGILVRQSNILDIDITGGTYWSRSGNAVYVGDNRTRATIDITGSSVLHGGSSTYAIVFFSAGYGPETLTVGSDAVLCRGTYVRGVCTQGPGRSVAMFRLDGSVATGTGTITNAGRMWGDIFINYRTASTITNQRDAEIFGNFAGGAGNTTVSNIGHWIMSGNFDFSGGTDSFTSRGLLTVRHAGSTLAMNNLETFTLNTGGALHFSLATGSLPSGALLNIGGATPNLAGFIDITTRDGSALPTSGTLLLITGTALSGSTSLTNLRLATSIGGTLSVVSNTLRLTLGTSSRCGTPTARAVQSPGQATRQVICDRNDRMSPATNILRGDSNLALIYRGRRGSGRQEINSIEHSGSGGEIHVEAGAVRRVDDGGVLGGTFTRPAVRLIHGGVNPLRLVVLSGASVSNLDTTPESHGVYVEGGGNIFLEIAGDTSAVRGSAIFAKTGRAGNVYLDITGGTHRSWSAVENTVLASLVSGSYMVDVDITGSSVLHGGSATAAVLKISGGMGADSIEIGADAILCRGTYADDACTQGAGYAIELAKDGTQGGSSTLTTAGTVWGGISASMLTVASTITNQAGGFIDGVFTGGTASSTVSTAGIWTVRDDFDFGGATDSDSFTVTEMGSLRVRYDGTTLAMNNLESFVINEGVLHFTIGSTTLPTGVLFNIGGASPTLNGVIRLSIRDGSTVPTSGVLTLIAGTSLSGATDISKLRVSHEIGGTLSINASNNLILTLGAKPSICGTPTARVVQTPGHANMELTCNYQDGLLHSTNIARSDARLALLYSGRNSDGSSYVNSLANTGSGGEIHMQSGSVRRVDDGSDSTTAGERAAVRLINSGTNPLRLVTATTTSVSNLDTTAQSHGIHVEGGGSVFLTVGGSSSAAQGSAIFAQAGGASGRVALSITGGVHTSDTAAVVSAAGIAGADTITISSGVVLCRGAYADDTCTQSTGTALSLGKSGTQGGTGTITTAGTIFGDITVSSLTVASTITNQAAGSIDGTFTGGTASSTVSNAGTWTLRSNFDFGGTADADTFTNTGTGTFIVHHDGTALAMNNLETFTLQAAGAGEGGGILRFSLATSSLPVAALLNIGGASPTLAGIIDVVTRSGSLPTSGSLTLITGTGIVSGTDITDLFLSAGTPGRLSISGSSLILTLGEAICGTPAMRDVVLPGHANTQVLCDHADSLFTTTDILRRNARLALLYRGTRADGSGFVRSLANVGPGGEIHILSGGVRRSDDGVHTGDANARAAVRLTNSGAQPLRLVTAPGTLVSNQDGSSGSHGIFVKGGGNVFLTVAGSTSASNTDSRAIYAESSAGNVDIDITGGTHISGGGVVYGYVSAGTGKVDIALTGSSILYGGTASTAVVESAGIGGADRIAISSGVVLCRGAYANGRCTVGTGNAISLTKGGTPAGSATITTAGTIWGGISVSTGTVSTTLTNQAEGIIFGAFTGGGDRSAVSNAGTWVMPGSFDFGSGTDSFVNTGALSVRYAGTTLAMNNLATFTLTSGGVLHFSLASATLPTGALLNIGSASPTLAGGIDISLRNGATLPTTGVITLISSTRFSGSTSLSNLRLAEGVGGTLSIDGSNNLILTLGTPSLACGAAVTRTVTLPGHANRQVTCNHNDKLYSTTNIARSDARLALLYRGTQSDGSGIVNSISNTGSGGEIHILSGSVRRLDDGVDPAAPSNSTAAVRLTNSGTNPLRFVMSANTSVSNLDTSSREHGVTVIGGGNVFLTVAGSTSAVGPNSAGVFAWANNAASVDIDITGGVHTSRYATVGAVSTGGAINIDITGSSTVLHGGNIQSDNGVILVGSTTGAGVYRVAIGSGAVVCRGVYAGGTCVRDRGGAIALQKVDNQSGSVSVLNSGQVWGHIYLGLLTVPVTVTNQAGGTIVGNFFEGSGASTVSNAGTWTMLSAFDFGGGTDSFTNTATGSFIIRYDGASHGIANLETFTLTKAGVLRFSLGQASSLPANALLHIFGATPTLEGLIDVVIRDGSTLPTSGSITLLTGTNIGATAASRLSLSSTVAGELSVSGNNLILTFTQPFCGTPDGAGCHNPWSCQHPAGLRPH